MKLEFIKGSASIMGVFFPHPTCSQQNRGQNSEIDPFDLVNRIQTNDATALGELYSIFHSTVRRGMTRRLGSQDSEDKLHDVFLVVVRMIREGELRDPSRLYAFIHAVVRRQVATVIENAIWTRARVADGAAMERLPTKSHDPEQTYSRNERQRLIQWVFSGLTDREKEILQRFYIDEQPAQLICRDMSLSQTQFRLLKSRAKARFGELGRRYQDCSQPAAA